MMRSGLARALTAAAILVLASAGGTAHADSLFDPALKFRVLPTEHFRIYFHQGEDRLAQRLAPIAEDTWRALQRPLGVTPPRLTHVVLADQTEYANGYATPLPYDTIVMYTVTPSGSSFEFDNWLRQTFTHEFTHIVHLDRSEGWARVARTIFGRAAWVFPNLVLPPWQIEGLATYEESIVTGEGRLHAGDFRAITGEAAREHRLEPLDRVNGGLTDWPSGDAVYAYGVGFHQYLADRFGVETLSALADSTARRLPYIASPAFKEIYGQSLGDLWRDYESGLATSAGAPGPDTTITRLTHQGFSVTGPRFDRFVCAGCPPEIVYSAVNPNGFPALYRIGLSGGEPRQLTTRYLGSTTAIGRDTIYFDQLEQRRNVGLYGDLYALTRADGHVRQLTSEARLLDPDLSPDGGTLACTQNRPGQRNLVLVRLKVVGDGLKAVPLQDRAAPLQNAVTTLIAEPDTQFDAPKWSPDGRTIAVERHRLGSMPEIVIVDVATRSVRVLASAPRTRFVMPAWRPDGVAIVAAAAPDEETFNLVEIAVDGSRIRPLTHTTGGATWPDVSADGKTIVFSGYTTEGYDIFSMPYPSPTPGIGASEPPSTPEHENDPQTRSDLKVGPYEPYNPLNTLTPTSWSPIVVADSAQVRVGAGISGYDVLGYHAYAANAAWLVSSPSGSQRPPAAEPDWQISYAYARWRPTFFATAASDTSFFAGPATEAGTPTSATRRERQIEGGVIFPVRHTRVQYAARLSIVRAVDDYTEAGGSFSRDRTPVRATWQINTARAYGYSVSKEGGITAGVTGEIVRQALGSSADATTVTTDVRAYVPGFAAHHVLALRAGGGASSGDQTVGRTFLLGGDSPGTSVVDLDGAAFTLLRGFSPNTFAGSHVAVVNAEYRFPLARPQRGHGTWPLFLHTLYATVFADAGQTWARTVVASDMKTSAGAQISADAIAGFFLPFTVTAGAAWGHDGSGQFTDRVTAYFRVGKSF